MKKQRLHWLGHVFRKNDSLPALKVFDAVPLVEAEGEENLHWKDNVEIDLISEGEDNAM